MMKDSLYINRNLPLPELLKVASREDLTILADIITDNGDGRMMLSSERKEVIIFHKDRDKLSDITLDLTQEICTFAGNTFINLFRSKPIDYIDVARDVAKKLGVKITKDTSIIEIEELIIKQQLEKILKDTEGKTAFFEFCRTERYALDTVVLDRLIKNNDTESVYKLIFLSLGYYGVSRLLVTALACNLGSIATSALIFATNAARLSTLLNPVFLILSAAWITYDLAGPAYRVTIPAVICISAIRQAWIKSMTDAFYLELKKCL